MTKRNCNRILIKHAVGTPADRTHPKTVIYPKHRFLFISSIGGVGKTSVLLNIALVFSKKGFKIGLLDLDIFGAPIHRILGIDQPYESDSSASVTPQVCSDTLKVAAIKYAWQNMEKIKGRRKSVETADIQRFIHNIHWGELDYLFADTPPGSGKVLRSAIRCMPDTKIIMVSAPHKISAAHAQKMINFLRKEEIQLFGWIENMRGFLCQGCNQRQELFSTGTGNRAIFLMEVPFLGRIPIDPHIGDCADAGQPYLEKYQNSEAAIAFNQVAEKILRFCAAQGAESDENISLRKGRKR